MFIADDQTLLGIEHAKPLRHVVEGSVKLMRFLRFRILGFDFVGYVLMGGDPSAIRRRIIYNGNNAPIGQGQYLGCGLPLADLNQQTTPVLLGVLSKKIAGCETEIEQLTQCAAGPHHLGRYVCAKRRSSSE